MANSTGPERVEALAHFGADFVIPGKIIHAVGGVCGVIRSQTKVMGAIEDVVSTLKNELGLEKTAQELAMATEKLEVAAQEKIAKSFAKELMESEVVNSEMNSFDKAKKAVKSEGPGIVLPKEYPNGKYVNNPKHHMNSKGNISKPPLDGQKALEESILVQTDKRGLSDRVGIENGKVVKFHEHQPGEYHGYIVEDVHGMDDAYKNALYEAGLIRSVKSCKVTK